MNLSKTVILNSKTLPSFTKLDAVLYLPYFKSLRHKLQNLPTIDNVCYEKAAFTLAETLITLVILGIVAAITIPTLMNRHRESANRTRIRKAMTAYEAALNKMVIENNLRADGDIDNWSGNNCANTRPYFKSAQDGANPCSFRTSDGTWWNITDIKNPLIALNNTEITDIADAKTKAKDTSDNTTYAMVGRFDAQGILRVDDLGVETSGDNNAYLTKLYGFANNVRNANGANGGNEEPVDPTRPCSDDTKNGDGKYFSCTQTFDLDTNYPSLPPIKDGSDIYYSGAEAYSPIAVYDDKGRISELYKPEESSAIHFIYESDDSNEVVDVESGYCPTAGQCVCSYVYSNTNWENNTTCTFFSVSH